MTGRAIPEWVGKVPDAPVPPRVRLRVFERAGGVCAISGRKIMPGDAWDLDHVVPLIDGGEHREGNLQPVLRDEHRRKSAEEAGRRAKERRLRKKHVGIEAAPRARIPGSRSDRWKRKINGRTVPRDEEA